MKLCISLCCNLLFICTTLFIIVCLLLILCIKKSILILVFLQNLLLWGDSSSSVTVTIKTNMCWYSPLAKYLSLSYVLYCLQVTFRGIVPFKAILKLVCWKSFIINIVSFPTHVKVNHFCLVLLPQLSWSTFFFLCFSIHSLTLLIGNRLLRVIFWTIGHLFLSEIYGTFPDF